MTGAALMPLGCGHSGDGKCTGGMVALGLGLVVTGGAIWLILDALPRGVVVPITRAAERPSRPTVRLGPGFIAGTF
jgi:hypothetical protein